MPRTFRTRYLLLAFWCLPVPAGAAVRNVILMIGDGMGYNHVLATDYYTGRPFAAAGFPLRLGMSTYSLSGAAGYDPAKAWESIDYLKDGPTDSAAAATAMGCGIKTENGRIGTGPDAEVPPNVVEAASAAGRATGVVTSVPWSHATPAGMVAHVDSRNSYADIAAQMLRSDLDLIMGAGHPLYDDNGESAEKVDEKYVGGPEVWGELSRSAFLDWRFIGAKADFEALAAGRLALGEGRARLCGTAQVRGTLQQGRGGYDAEDQPGDVAPNADVPDLPTMTRGALEFLGADPDGFFLMIEGGAIDWAGHGNQIARIIEETTDFSAAVAAVVEWVDTHDAWDDTLVVVTADHETGGLWGEPKGELTDLADRGPGNLPGFAFNTGSHTNALVPFYARGAGTDLLAAAADEADPRRGAYLDNAELGRILIAATGPEPAAVLGARQGRSLASLPVR